MARASWIDDDNHPDIDAHMSQLEHFTQSLADGEVDAEELATQENRLITAMREAEAVLDDAQHAKVTKLIAELAAYTVMELLHSMAKARVEKAIN
jgi:predicted transcriptional regulator